MIVILALVLAFLCGGVAATWAWALLVLVAHKRQAEADQEARK